MENESLSEEQLARLIDRRLQTLPTPKAPATLAPRVMAAVIAHQMRPWWRRAWVFWPRQFQFLFVCVALGLVGTGAWFLGGFNPSAVLLKARDLVVDHLAFAHPIVVVGSAFADIGLKMAHSISTTTWVIAGTVIAAAYASCLGLGTFCYRLAFSPNNS